MARLKPCEPLLLDNGGQCTPTACYPTRQPAGEAWLLTHFDRENPGEPQRVAARVPHTNQALASRDPLTHRRGEKLEQPQEPD